MTTLTLDTIPKRSPSTQYQIAILTDLGSVVLTSGGNYDWDDQFNLAMALCTQDKFKIRFIGTDNSSHAWNAPTYALKEMFTAYASDLLTGTLPAGSLSQEELLAISCAGAVNFGGTPSTGYRVLNDTDYQPVHFAAQRFIRVARDCGDPSGTYQTNPYGKLWVAINGGYGVFAQILKEAVADGGLSDILDRCVFFGCPPWNAYHTEPAWDYFTNNCYFVNSSTPGLFGAVNMIEVHPLMDGVFSNSTSTAQATAWATMKTQGAMGAFIESARVGSTAGAVNSIRAGESPMMQYWLLEAERLNSWNPANTSNGAGHGFQLYNSVNWPYLHGGTGTWSASSYWPSTETKYSPNHWGSPAAMNSQALSLAALDETGYLSWMTTNWARYA